MESEMEESVSDQPSPSTHKWLSLQARQSGFIEEDDKTPAGVVSIEELIGQVKALQPAATCNGWSLARLEAILTHIIDFAAVFAFCNGAGLKTTALAWAIIRITLLYTTPIDNAYDDVLGSLDDMSLALRRFRSYEDTLLMSTASESLLVDVYAEMIHVCARAGDLLRRSPHRSILWSRQRKLDTDFKEVAACFKALSSTVDAHAETLPLHTSTVSKHRAVQEMDKLCSQTSDGIEDAGHPGCLIPTETSSKPFEREAYLQAIESVISSTSDAKQRSRYFDTAIALLSNGFPNTWNTVVGHQFASWEDCGALPPHVKFLMARSKQYSIVPSYPTIYAELILRVCWHLYEKESYNLANRFMDTALGLIEDRSSLMFASASTLRGLIELDIHNVPAALRHFQVGLQIRRKLLEPEDAFIASSWNAISLAYTELHQMDLAIECGQMAIDIRLFTNSDRFGNSYSNMASALLRMGKADEAEKMLKRCPALKHHTDETFLKTNNPRFAGDMILLARIRQAQGRLDDAISLSSKALALRQKMFGSGLKTCDCLYHVGTLLEQRGDLSLAADRLEDSVLIADNVSFGEGHSARANFRLSEIYKKLGKTELGAACGVVAKALLRTKLGGSTPEEPSQRDFDIVVPWMLW